MQKQNTEKNIKEMKSYSHYNAGYDIYFKETYNKELTIRDYIKREQKEKVQKVALAYIDFLEENELEIRKDNGDYWKDNIYYWIVYKEKCVAFIAIKDPSEPDTDWTVYSDDINDKYLLDEYVTEEEKRIAFEHIDSCRCGGGPKKMFGKDVEWCYGTNFRFNVPIMKDLPFIKKWYY